MSWLRVIELALAVFETADKVTTKLRQARARRSERRAEREIRRRLKK